MDTGGIYKFLARTLTLGQIKALSATCHAAILAGEDTVAITSNGFESGNASGQLMVSAIEVGKVCEDLIEQAEGPAFSRQAWVRADMSYATTGGAN
jgi:hypothetical protein